MYSSYKVEKITVKSFRGISYESSINFKDITILCGENGTGKSSFVNAFEYIFSKKINFLNRGTIDNEKSIIHSGNDKKDMDIQIFFKNGEILQLTKKPTAELKDILSDEYVKNASFILNRRNLLEFIEGTSSDRYNAIMNLCGFKKLIKYQNTLNTVFNDINKDLKNKKSEYQNKLSNFSEILSADDYDSALNQLNKLLNKNNHPMVNENTDISDYLTKFQIKNKNNLLDDIFNEFNFNINYDISDVIDSLNKELNELLQSYDDVVYDNFKSNEDLIFLLENSYNYINKNKLDNCPVCDSNINFQSLSPKLKTKIYHLKEENNNFSLWKNKLNTVLHKLDELNNYLANVDSMLPSIMKVIVESSKQNKEFADSSLNENGVDLKEISKFFNTFNFNEERLILNELYSNLNDLINIGEKKELNRNLFKTIDKKINILKVHLNDYYKLLNDDQDIVVINNALIEFDKLIELNNQIKKLKQKYKLTEITLKTFKKSKESFINGIINDIREDITNFYNYIHRHDEITSPDMQLVDTNKLDVYLDSFGETVDPRSYASEGHLDSLGLCIFLAFNKKFNKIPLIILDDVIATVDLNHKEKIAKLLIDELNDYQIFITTHSKLWANQLRRLTFNTSIKPELHEIIQWNLNEGPILTKPISSEDKIEKYLSTEYYDLNAAGNTARRYLEHILKQICIVNEIPIPYSDQPSLEDLFSKAMKVTKKSVKKTTIQLYYETVWGELDRVKFMANILSHDNINFDEVSFEEVKNFCTNVLNLKKAFTCWDDGHFLKLDKESKKIRCNYRKCMKSMDMNEFK